MGDIYVNPLLLNWSAGNNYFTFGLGITARTGQYDADRLLNVGRNYWSFDLTGAYTYFDPKSGLDISATAGFMFNAENPDTDYCTGTEFHLDWLVGKFLTPNFALAVADVLLTALILCLHLLLQSSDRAKPHASCELSS